MIQDKNAQISYRQEGGAKQHPSYELSLADYMRLRSAPLLELSSLCTRRAKTQDNRTIFHWRIAATKWPCLPQRRKRPRWCCKLLIMSMFMDISPWPLLLCLTSSTLILGWAAGWAIGHRLTGGHSTLSIFLTLRAHRLAVHGLSLSLSLALFHGPNTSKNNCTLLMFAGQYTGRRARKLEQSCIKAGKRKSNIQQCGPHLQTKVHWPGHTLVTHAYTQHLTHACRHLSFPTLQAKPRICGSWGLPNSLGFPKLLWPDALESVRGKGNPPILHHSRVRSLAAHSGKRVRNSSASACTACPRELAFAKQDCIRSFALSSPMLFFVSGANPPSHPKLDWRRRQNPKNGTVGNPENYMKN